MPGRLVLNRSAVRALLRDAALAEELKARAAKIAAKANEGLAVPDQGDFAVSEASRRGGGRVAVRVYGTDPYANRREAAHRALSQAVDAGREGRG